MKTCSVSITMVCDVFDLNNIKRDITQNYIQWDLLCSAAKYIYIDASNDKQRVIK